MFGIKTYDKEQYNRHFLRDVVFTVHFKDNVACTTNRDKFISSLKDDYPTCHDGIAQDISVTLGNGKQGNSVIINNNNDSHQTILRTEDMMKEFVLRNNSLQYKESGHTYKGSQSFNTQLEKALQFLKFNGTEECKALSLRKVNIIDFKSNSNSDNSQQDIPTYGPAHELLSNKLLPTYESYNECNKYVVQNLQSLRLRDTDYNLEIKYGYLVGEKSENLDYVKGQVVLDLLLERIGNISIQNIDKELTNFHNILYDVFRWATTEKMLEILEKR